MITYVTCVSNGGHGGAWAEQVDCAGHDPDLPSKEATGGEAVRIPVSVFFSFLVLKSVTVQRMEAGFSSDSEKQ